MWELLKALAGAQGIARPSLLLTRFFCRIKSADSILEKAKRKGIITDSPEQLADKFTDILGIRVIVETPEELLALDRLIGSLFEVVWRLDETQSPSEFGERGIKYDLRYHADGAVHLFELQTRTFLQHFWASRSFHLFHKKENEVATKHRSTLLALSEALECAEQLAAKLDQSQPVYPGANKHEYDAKTLWSRVNLVVVKPGECFYCQMTQNLSGDDRKDHEETVARKLQLYRDHPGAAIVECCCFDFSTFMLNEPHVIIPTDRFLKLSEQV
jgi:ppGpp synthetase/RelA/SpoT-type nucleotidyltranferase